MFAHRPTPHPGRYVGLLFDMAGFYPAAVHRFVTGRRMRRARNVEEALKADMSAIAGDMRRTLDKWMSRHG
jgi:hypothetical protein